MNEYEKLLNKPDKIEIKTINENINISSDFKNPIIINVPKNVEIKTEKDLENAILAEIHLFLTRLGSGFTFVGSQYQITCENKTKRSKALR